MVKHAKYTFTVLAVVNSSVVLCAFSTICCFISLLKKIIHLWPHWVLAAECGFLLWWFLLFCSLGSRTGLQELWCTGLVAPQHVGSSGTRDQTRVPCIGRRILYPWATREALLQSSLR